MAMTVTSSSPTSNYHVFLSFRGKDTRHGFTGHLYKALTDKGIHTFIDDEELQSGEEITTALENAIQGSKIAIIVLSENYAFSSFCLDELFTIIHYMSRGLLVIPVFYKVDPSNIRHHKGSYGDAFAKHERRLPEKKLQNWKMALRRVADLSGYHFKQGDKYEFNFIESIVASVLKKINHPARLLVGDCLVGLKSQVVTVMRLLNVGSDDGVQMVGIHGMGGIGKSTLARAVYNNLISLNFDGLCYLENVREKSNKNGLEYLQNMLLQEILKDKSITVTNWRQGASVIEDRLQGKKVLLALDDVDKYHQLQAILGRPCWFGPGSRVIITTRDEQMLKCHEVRNRYEVNELNNDNALQLLTWHAFKKEKADPTYVDVLNRVVTYASGLPLALEVMGSNLFGKSMDTWESAINQYKRIPHNQVQDILKVSFDHLQEEEKSVFLDISCCFKGYRLQEVEVMLGALYDDSMRHHIDVLVDKSLIKFKWDDTVEMHDLIQDIGRQIDQKESHKKPRKRKRLWSCKDIIEVLKHNKGTSKIEIIYLDVPASDREQIIEWDGNGFKKLKNLKILIIKNAKFSEGPKCLPNSLRVLEWWGYPSNCLPSDFQPHKFVICNLPRGCFTSFELDRSSKMFQNVTVLKFDECKSLTKIPDLSHLSNLEKLSFEWCENLVSVHESIGSRLRKVKEISACGCINLVSFPPLCLTSLENLDLSETGLESFPEILGKMENLKTLELYDTPIAELPISFVNLIGLQHFIIDFSRSTVLKLPSRILVMPELTYFSATFLEGVKWVKEEENEETTASIVSSKIECLDLSCCNLDYEFFSIVFTRLVHVTELKLSMNDFKFLPECIKDFQSLRILDVSYSHHLQQIRGLPPNIKYIDVRFCEHLQEIRGIPPIMEHFDASKCKSLTCLPRIMLRKEESHAAQITNFCLPGAWIPKWFDHKSRGPSTSFWFRNNVPTKILCLLISIIYDKKPMVFINGKKVNNEYAIHGLWGTEDVEIMDHTSIFELDLKRYVSEYKVGLEKEWNHVEVTYGVMRTSIIKYEVPYVYSSDIKAMGIHVFKEGERSEEDIRVSDPYRKRKLDDYLNSSESDNSRLPKRCRRGDGSFMATI